MERGARDQSTATRSVSRDTLWQFEQGSAADRAVARGSRDITSRFSEIPVHSPVTVHEHAVLACMVPTTRGNSGPCMTR